MVVRIARFEGIDVEAAKRTMEEAVSIIRPMIQGLAGYAGATELVSDGGVFISMTFFDDMASAEAAEPTFDQEMPAKLGHLFQEWSGHRASVERFEVVADVRP